MGLKANPLLEMPAEKADCSDSAMAARQNEETGPMLSCVAFAKSPGERLNDVLFSINEMTGAMVASGIKGNVGAGDNVLYKVSFDVIPELPCTLNCIHSGSKGVVFDVKLDQVAMAKKKIRTKAEHLYAVEPIVITLLSEDIDWDLEGPEIGLQVHDMSALESETFYLPRFNKPLYFLVVRE